jgi:hypothetical protein
MWTVNRAATRANAVKLRRSATSIAREPQKNLKLQRSAMFRELMNVR